MIRPPHFFSSVARNGRYILPLPFFSGSRFWLDEKLYREFATLITGDMYPSVFARRGCQICPPVSACHERFRLSSAVAKAVQDVYRARAE